MSSRSQLTGNIFFPPMSVVLQEVKLSEGSEMQDCLKGSRHYIIRVGHAT